MTKHKWTAEEIRALRKKAKLSQRKFAKKLGISRRTLIYWETGKTSPQGKNLEKLDKVALEVQDSGVQNSEVQDSKVQDSKVQDSGVQNSGVQNSEVQDSKVQDSKVQDSGVQNSEQEATVQSDNPKSYNQESQSDTDDTEDAPAEASSKESVNSEEQANRRSHPSNQGSKQVSGGEQANNDNSENKDDSSKEALVDEPTEGGRWKISGKRRSPFVQSVLDQIPIEGEIGKDVQLKHSSRKFVGLCPFHNDTHPSFEVYPHTQSWFCYGCQKGGSLIDYVMYRDGLTPAEAIHRLCETYNIPQPSWNEKEKAEWENNPLTLFIKGETKEEKELIASINLATFKWYHDNMPQERRKKYHERGVIDETIDKELFGYAPDNDAIVGEMLKNYKAEQLVSSGLFTVINGCLEPIYKRRYVIPYWEDGKIVYSIGRLDTNDPDEIAQLPEWNRGKYKKQLVHSEKHPEVSKVVKNVIWNADGVGDYETGSIAEGIIDGILHRQISDEIMVICVQAGLSPQMTIDKPACGVGVISPVTTKFSNSDYQQLINLTEHWEKVYCIADNEVSGAGIKGAVSTAKTLFNAGRNPYVVLPPRPDDVEKVDLADYLNVPEDQKEARTKEFAQLLSSSPSLLDYLIEEARNIEDTTKQDEQITEIVNLMVTLPPLKLERYKQTLEAEFGLKSRVFNQLYKEAEKEKAKEAREVRYRLQAGLSPQITITGRQDEINAINVEYEKPTDDTTPRRYGDVIETEEGYAQISFSPISGMQETKLSSFLIKPKSRLWIDDYEAVSTDLVTSKRGSAKSNGRLRLTATALSTGKTYSTIFERHHWNELNAFMSRLPSIDLVWQGKLPEVQAVMGIVNSYEVPVQKGTRQIGWHARNAEGNELVWVSKDINFATDGFIDPPEVLYCPYPGEMEIEHAISFKLA